MARASENNPDYLSQACHSVRELIDNLPKYFQVTVKRTGSLKDQVISLQSAWEREPRVRNASAEPLSERFAKKVEGLLKWFADNFPARREVCSDHGSRTRTRLRPPHASPDRGRTSR